MTDTQRITELEKRLASAEGRLAVLENRTSTYYYYYYPLNYQGFTCWKCKSWVPVGQYHVCSGNLN